MNKSPRSTLVHPRAGDARYGRQLHRPQHARRARACAHQGAEFSTEQYSYHRRRVPDLLQPDAAHRRLHHRLHRAEARVLHVRPDLGDGCALHALAGSWQGWPGSGQCWASAKRPRSLGREDSTNWFPPKERSIATGWFNTGSSVGAMIAPPLVVWLSLTWGWQVAFIVTGLMAVGVSILWLLLYRDPEKHRASARRSAPTSLATSPRPRFRSRR